MLAIGDSGLFPASAAEADLTRAKGPAAKGADSSIVGKETAVSGNAQTP